jgi:hypothetical protein
VLAVFSHFRLQRTIVPVASTTAVSASMKSDRPDQKIVGTRFTGIGTVLVMADRRGNGAASVSRRTLARHCSAYIWPRH